MFEIMANAHVCAFLDDFPAAKGHTLLVPRAEGFASLLDMPADDAAALLREVPALASAVKEATKADGVNIVINCGKAAGQTVFHTHVHVLPRFAGDHLPRHLITPDAERYTKSRVTETEGRPITQAVKAAMAKYR